MTVEQKLARLTPSHHHFERVLDPWHVDAFVGTPAEGHGIGGERRVVWYSVDWCGNLIQCWGEDTPPGVEASDKDGQKIIAGCPANE
jgi:hypothetical protein